MKNLKAPFPYFGGKHKAIELVWSHFHNVKNYVEPFCGSAAMLLGSPDRNFVSTINDFDGYVANFWRAIQKDPTGVAEYCDYPVSEVDLTSRHMWLLQQKQKLMANLLGDPDFYDTKIAGWWCWATCSWIGTGLLEGKGPWIHDGTSIVDSRKNDYDIVNNIRRKLPHLGDSGKGINSSSCPDRFAFIVNWFNLIQEKLRDTRIACGSWERVLSESVTTRHGLTGIFLDPPYEKGNQQYAAGGTGTDISKNVQKWGIENCNNDLLKIAICGHDGEHDELLKHGFFKKHWKSGGGYARTEEAIANRKSETIWFSKNCDAVVSLLNSFE